MDGKESQLSAGGHELGSLRALVSFSPHSSWAPWAGREGLRGSRGVWLDMDFRKVPLVIGWRRDEEAVREAWDVAGI